MSARRLGVGRTALAPRILGLDYAAAYLADSPWGFWKSDEASGTTLADSSGNSRPMSVGSGAPTFNVTGPGVGTKAMTWPDSGGATEYYAGTAATMASGTITLEAWFYLTATATALTPIIGLSAGYASGTYDKDLFINTNGSLQFYTTGNNIVTAASLVTLNTWHHVIASVGAAGHVIRLDKATVATGGNTSSYGGAQNVYIHGGGSGSPNVANGNALTVGPCAAWTTQLTDVQTDAHYNAII